LKKKYCFLVEFFFIFLFISCVNSNFIPLEIKINSVKRINIKKNKIILKVNINNKNNYSFDIIKTNFDIYLNGKKIAVINNNLKVKIKKNKNTIIKIPVSWNFKKINVFDILRPNYIVGIKGYIVYKYFIIKRKYFVENKIKIKL